MPKSLIRLLAFFAKEINEVRRQPRLVLSLILGPFLILTLFGAGYVGESPNLRTILVVPTERLNDPRLDELTKTLGPNFQLVEVTDDQAAAMARLTRRETDVVEVFPDDFEQLVINGQHAQVDFHYNEINQLNEKWIQYLSYVQVIQLNQQVLRGATVQAQGDARQTRDQLREVREQLDAIDQNVSNLNRDETLESIRRLRDTLAVLALSPAIVSGTDGGQTRQDIELLQSDLETLETAVRENQVATQRERIRETRDRVATMEQTVGRLADASPDAIISPLQQQYINERGAALPLHLFYGPGVLALILQHIAITLGALSLVRERLLGALEIFGVAPVSPLQVLLGKYLAYILFLAVITGLLIALLVFGLGVPLLGDWLTLVGLLLLFIVASLGVGFLLSTLSTSDSQAIQLSMLLLLLSIFFSGFFLPLENFIPQVRIVSYLLPLTHAIIALQELMLRGTQPPTWIWGSLGLIAVVSFIAVLLLWRRQARKLA